MADKKAVFVVRGDGSVVASKNNNSGWFAGNPLMHSFEAWGLDHRARTGA